jgi:hypothetical protein
VKRAAFWVAGATVVAACSSASIRGGTAQGERRALPGVTLTSYAEVDCRDSSSAPVERSATLFVLQQQDGHVVVAELVPARDTLVAEQHFADGDEAVYQVVVEPASGRPVLHDYRIPKRGGKDGRMALTERWSEQELPDGGFRATPTGPVLSCLLAAAKEVADGGADAP